jgi:hypothetical protein
MKTMKFYNLLSLLLVVLVIPFSSCEENEAMPSYKKIGTATATIASIAVSSTTPASGGVVTVTMKYVNINSDPASSLVLKYREGSSGDFTTVQTFDESSQSTGVEITRTYEFDVTQTAGTTLTFRMELHSQVEFPKLVQSPVVTVQ